TEPLLVGVCPVQRPPHFAVVLALIGTEFLIERKIAAPEPHPDRDESAFEEAGLFGARRRQIVTQDIAAAEQVAAVHQQHAVAIIDTRARLGRRDQPAQDRPNPLRIDRKVEPVQRILVWTVAFTRMQIEKLVGIERDRGIGFHRRRGRDRAGDDLALHQKTLNACVDQAGAELRQHDNADRQRNQTGEVENDDAPSEARRTLGNKELPAARQPSAEAATLTRGYLVEADALGLVLTFDGSFRRCICVYGSVEHVVCRGFDRLSACPSPPSIAEKAGGTPDAITTARQPPSQEPYLRLCLPAARPDFAHYSLPLRRASATEAPRSIAHARFAPVGVRDHARRAIP